jgi:hypothetical protein
MTMILTPLSNFQNAIFLKYGPDKTMSSTVHVLNLNIFRQIKLNLLIAVATVVFGRLNDGIVGSNPSRSKDVCLLFPRFYFLV